MSFKIGAFDWKINCKILKERPAAPELTGTNRRLFVGNNNKNKILNQEDS